LPSQRDLLEEGATIMLVGGGGGTWTKIVGEPN